LMPALERKHCREWKFQNTGPRHQAFRIIGKEKRTTGM
jgi:hypothetical protein